MTAQPTGPRLSKSSLLSLICGILGCIPFVTGGLAVLLGIVGIVRTGNPEKKGRWMAVVGLLLGIASIGAWGVFGTGALIAYFSGSAIVAAVTGAPAATHDFIKGLAENDPALISKYDGGFKKETLQEYTDYFKPLGKFVDTSFNTSITNDNAEVTGTATFETGKQNVKANLIYKDSVWKVVELDVSPVGAH